MSAFMRALKQQLDDEEPEVAVEEHSNVNLREPVVKLNDRTFLILLSSKFNRASLSGVFHAQCLFGAVDVANTVLCARHECPSTARHLQKQTFRLQPSRSMNIATTAETPVVLELLWDVLPSVQSEAQPSVQQPDATRSQQLIDGVNKLAAFAVARGVGKDKVALLQITLQKPDQLFTTSMLPSVAARSSPSSAQEAPSAKRTKPLGRCLPKLSWQPKMASLVIGQDWLGHATTFTKLHKRWVKRQRSVSSGDSQPRWPSVMIIGAKGVGKSTFARFLCNKYETMAAMTFICA